MIEFKDPGAAMRMRMKNIAPNCGECTHMSGFGWSRPWCHIHDLRGDKVVRSATSGPTGINNWVCDEFTDDPTPEPR